MTETTSLGGTSVGAPASNDVMPSDRTTLLETQLVRLQATVELAFDRIPFYRRKLSAANVSPADIASIADITKLPLTTKEELRTSEAAAPPLGDYRGAPLRSCVRISTSSGSTGRPTVNLMTARDAEIEYLLMARTFRRNGLLPGDIAVNTHPGYLYGGSEFMAAFHQAYGMMALGLGPLGTDDEVDAHLRLLHDLQPRSAVLFAPSLIRLRDLARSRQQRSFPSDYGIEIMSLNEFSLQFPDTRRWFEELLGVRLYNNFGFSEIFSGTGSSCHVGAGNHINEDYAVVEVVDPKTLEPLPDGQAGAVVVTSLGKDNPLLRYAVGDVGYIDPTPCACGEPTRLFFRLGRSIDTIDVQGHQIANADIINALVGLPGLDLNVLSYQVILRSDPPHEQLEIVVPPADDAAGFDEADVSRLLSLRLGAPASLSVTTRNDFSYKPQRIVRL